MKPITVVLSEAEAWMTIFSIPFISIALHSFGEPTTLPAWTWRKGRAWKLVGAGYRLHKGQRTTSLTLRSGGGRRRARCRATSKLSCLRRVHLINGFQDGLVVDKLVPFSGNGMHSSAKRFLYQPPILRGLSIKRENRMRDRRPGHGFGCGGNGGSAGAVGVCACAEGRFRRTAGAGDGENNSKLPDGGNSDGCPDMPM
jgi:hypothetical protein